MAVTKLWYVTMLLVFISQFSYRTNGDETKEIHKSIKTLLSVQNLVTGYPVAKEGTYNFQSLKNWSLLALQNKIADSYDQLECGYLFGAQLHMKLTRDALFGHAKTNNGYPETVKTFSFEEEATMMIDSLLDPKHGRVNELWLLLIYTRQMRRLMRRMENGNGGFNSEMISESQWMHDFVLFAIEKRIADGCSRKISLNMKYEKCKHWPFADGPSTKGKGFLSSLMVQPPIAKYDDQINAIRANKELLRKNFRENLDKGLLRLSNFESLSDDFLLLFPDGQAFQVFVEDFLADHSDRVQVEFPGLEFERNLSAVKALGEYQQRVIGTLEIIMLQIILSYTNLLSESDNILQDAKKFNFLVLDPYQYLMEYDTEFDDIYDGFLQCHDDIEACQKFLNIEIVDQIKTITNKNNLPEIKSTVIGSDTSLDGVRGVGVKLVDKIKEDIGEKSIRMVKSFLKMIDEKFLLF